MIRNVSLISRNATGRNWMPTRPWSKNLEVCCGSGGAITLLYAAKDPIVNHAAVLRDYMRENMA